MTLQISSTKFLMKKKKNRTSAIILFSPTFEDWEETEKQRKETEL